MMSLSKENAKKLLLLQEVDTDIARIERRLGKIEEERRELEETKRELVEEIASLQKQSQDLEREVKELKEEIREKELQLDRTEKKLNYVKKESEYKAFLKEKAKLEDFILKTSYQVEELERKLEELKKKLRDEIPKLRRRIEEIEEELEDLDYEEKTALRRLDELKSERELKAKGLEPELLSFYNSAKERFDSLVLVPVEESACAGCGMVIPDLLYSHLIKEESIEQCPNCGRFIYYKLG